ncbi:MAG: hypothetical protein NVSMB19_15830 [Vulcanimicrobiaceae bacterium]
MGSRRDDNEKVALYSAIALVVAAALVPALFQSAEGFGGIGVGIAALVSLTWFARYHATNANPFH